MAPKKPADKKGAGDKKGADDKKGAGDKKGEDDKEGAGGTSLRPKNMMYATAASSLVAIFVFLYCIYIYVVSTGKHEYRKPMSAARRTLSKAKKDKDFVQIPYPDVIVEARTLERKNLDLNDVFEKDKLIYRHIFKTAQMPPKQSREEWDVFGQSVYYIANDQEKTWYDAEDFCLQRGGHLAIVQTEEDQYFISVLAKQPIWIGLWNGNVKGEWDWTDGSSVLTQFWSTIPSNVPSNRPSCAYIEPSTSIRNWKHAECFDLKKWVCREKLDGVRLRS